MADAPFVFHCITGISEEHQKLIAKHETLQRNVIVQKLFEQKILESEQTLHVLDQIVHRAIKDALLKEEQESRAKEARAALTASKSG